MRILLTGKNGQVGSELNKIFAPFGEITATGKSDLDLSDPNQIRSVVNQIRPEIIINAAAYTSVDKAESERELAQAINGTAPKIFAEEAKKIGAVLIHYSTDYTYSGKMKNNPYIESDSSDPINTYGKTKLEGDKAIEQTGLPFLIFRSSWVYGLDGKNFLRTILRLARDNNELNIVNDQIGTPTWCRSIANATFKIINQLSKNTEIPFPEIVSGFSGVYHMTCEGETSWHGFAQSILKLTEPSCMSKLTAIPTKEYPTPAKRPTYTVLSNKKLYETFGIKLPHWEDALKHCLKVTS